MLAAERKFRVLPGVSRPSPMAEVILFNHIPKTAGSTLKHILWSAVGGDRVLFSMGFHDERLPGLREQLDRPLAGPHALVAHTGYGLHERLPGRHEYPAFTILRDPVERTVSEYFAGVSKGRIAEGTPIEDFLADDVYRSFNRQTAFIGGLSARHNLDRVPARRDQYDAELLERAKRNLEAHEVVGLTERFDETLLLLRDAYGWSAVSTLYAPVNVSDRRRVAPDPSASELTSIRAANALDIELYEHARGLFEAGLAAQQSDPERRLRRFRRLNGAYRRGHPILDPSLRGLGRLARGARRSVIPG